MFPSKVRTAARKYAGFPLSAGSIKSTQFPASSMIEVKNGNNRTDKAQSAPLETPRKRFWNASDGGWLAALFRLKTERSYAAVFGGRRPLR